MPVTHTDGDGPTVLRALCVQYIAIYSRRKCIHIIWKTKCCGKKNIERGVEMRWKELTNLIPIRRLLSALSALLNKRVMTWMLQKKLLR